MFLNIDLHFVISAVITHIFIVAAELAIPTGIPTEEANVKVDTHSVTVKARISICSVQFTEFKILQTFLCFLLINWFCFNSSLK